MKTKTLEMLFVMLVGLVFVFLVVLILVNEAERKNEFGGFKEITGSMQSFEVVHDKTIKYEPTKTTDKYNDKYLEYLESIKESRDKTFLR